MKSFYTIICRPKYMVPTGEKSFRWERGFSFPIAKYDASNRILVTRWFGLLRQWYQEPHPKKARTSFDIKETSKYATVPALWVNQERDPTIDEIGDLIDKIRLIVTAHGNSLHRWSEI